MELVELEVRDVLRLPGGVVQRDDDQLADIVIDYEDTHQKCHDDGQNQPVDVVPNSGGVVVSVGFPYACLLYTSSCV